MTRLENYGRRPESDGVGPLARFEELERQLSDAVISLKELTRDTDLNSFPIEGLKPTFDRIKILQSGTLPSLTKQLKFLRNSIATRMVDNRRKNPSKGTKSFENQVYHLNDKLYILKENNLIEVTSSDVKDEDDE